MSEPQSAGRRLRRPLVARLFGTITQGVLSFVALITIGLVVTVVIAAAAGKSVGGVTLLAVVPLLLTALWARGLTAWTSFDDEGVHTRYFVRSDHPWGKIHSITLQRLENVASVRSRGAPAIIVRMKGSSAVEDRLDPVLRCGRRRREFGTALLAAARDHGVRAVVGSTGWDEAPETEVAPFE